MKVGLALGSNVGDRLRQLHEAKYFLTSFSSDGACLSSPIYETEPVDCPPGSAAFYNAVVEIETDISPRALLARFQEYERAAGRAARQPRNAPRLIDIDILYCGDQRSDEPELILPHPRMRERKFVLLPLAVIRPEWVIPGTARTVRQLLQELPEDGPRVTLVQNEW